MKNFYDRSPDISRHVSQALNLSAEAAALKGPGKPQLAVFVTHGMGQQVPFETLDSVVEGLAQAASRKHGLTSDIRTRMVQIGEVKTQRAEFDMRDASGKDVEVHVYEGYWAPITEGQVTLRDVMSFLFGAGISGLWNSCSPFKRWIFGKPVTFGKQHRAAIKLLVTLLVLLSLIAINAFTTTVSGDRIIHHAGNQAFSEATFGALTTVAGVYVFATLVFGGALWWATSKSKCLKPPKNLPYWTGINKALQLSLQLWIALTIISALLMTCLAIGHLLPERFRLTPQSFTAEFMKHLWLGIWLLLFAISWKVRALFVQYMGDVAAYVDSHSLDRFNDMRTRIKSHVFDMAKVVYSNPQYERIAMVGHSLGSAITYDTMNALINHDQLNGGALKVMDRTRLLLTFGSPLDKFAFIFASQVSKATATREALAATLQPLIQAYIPFRNIKWVNIWSPRDIVSGALEFYDDKDDANYARMKVDNITDSDALIPLAAHIEYWNNPLVFDTLYANL